MYACLAVTCHLHFWQNDRDFWRATVVTRGWNGYQNKSQHRKSTLEKKILPPFQQGFKPATFQSRVRHSNHWAIPAPSHTMSMTYTINMLSHIPTRPFNHWKKFNAKQLGTWPTTTRTDRRHPYIHAQKVKANKSKKRRQQNCLGMLYKINNSLVLVDINPASFFTHCDPTTRGAQRLHQEQARHLVLFHSFFFHATSEWNTLLAAISSAPCFEYRVLPESTRQQSPQPAASPPSLHQHQDHVVLTLDHLVNFLVLKTPEALTVTIF